MIFNDRKWMWVIPAILLGLGLLLYANTFDVPFYFDDNLTIVENNIIKSLNNIRWLFNFDPSRFLVYLSFALNYQWNGLNVWGYHGVNVAAHLSAALLVYIFLRLTLKRDDYFYRHPNDAVLVSALVTLLFIVHPLQTQAVTYISQRSTLFASFFYLATLIFYILYRDDKKMEYYLIALFCMFMGLFTKPIIVTLPLAIILYEIFFYQLSWTRLKKEWIRFLPFFLLAALVPLLLTLWKYRTLEGQNYLAMTRETMKYTRWEYLMTQFNVMMTYARLYILPINQNLDYDYPVARNFFSFPTWISFLVIVGIMGGAIRVFKKHRLISFSIFWIFVTLSLESSIFPISDVINEHRLYLPMIGLGLITVLGFKRIMPHKSFFLLAVVLLAAIFSVLTYQRNELWRTGVGFFIDVRNKSPNKSRVHNNLGIALSAAGNLAAAEEEYKKAIELNPQYAHPHNNLANIYFQQEKYDEAKEELDKAIAIDPRHGGAHYNMGNIYWQKNDYQKAAEYYVKAIEYQPSFVLAIVSMGRFYHRMGDFVRAEFSYQSAMRINPGYEGTYVNLADLYLSQGKFSKAVENYGKALQLNPDQVLVYNNMANVYDMTGQFELAEEAYRQAIARDPAYGNAYFNLANTLKKMGEIQEAKNVLEKAIELFKREKNATMLKNAEDRLRQMNPAKLPSASGEWSEDGSR